MRKIIISVCLLILLPSLLFAGSLFSLGFGSINQFQLDLFNPETQFASVIDVHNWATGGEIRAKVLGINLEGYLLIQQGDIIDVTETGMPVFQDDIAQRLFGMVGLGFSTKVAELTTLSLAAGALTGFDISQDFGVTFWMGERENVYGEKKVADFFSQIPLAYRARIDLNLGSFSLGFHYQVPSQGFTYANRADTNALIPNWQEGKIGASFITRLF